jgi:hypothetical protein
VGLAVRPRVRRNTVDLTIAFDSGTELDLRGEPATFRTLARHLAEHGLTDLAGNLNANARRIKVPDADRAEAGMAFAAMLEEL